MKKKKRIFIVAPNGQNPADRRHDVCETDYLKGDLLDIYGMDLYNVVGSRQSLGCAKRLAARLGAEHPAVI